jgi:hypothetical protein
MMKRFEFIYICLLLLLQAASCGPTAKKAETVDLPDLPSDWRVWDGGDCQLRYPPSGWEVRSDLPGARLCLLSEQTASDDLFRDNVNLVVEPLSEAISVDKYASLAVKKIDSRYRVSSVKKYVSGGREYFHLILTGEDRLLVCLHIFVKDKKASILTFTYESNASGRIKCEGDRIMKSFVYK